MKRAQKNRFGERLFRTSRLVISTSTGRAKHYNWSHKDNTILLQVNFMLLLVQ
jgi:hypothetical protein